MKRSAINKDTRIMTLTEFKQFMKNKTLYHHTCNWLEKCTYIMNKPYILSGTILPNKVKLRHYGGDGYGKDCLDYYTTKGGFICDMRRWSASYNKSNKLFYVTTYGGKK